MNLKQKIEEWEKVKNEISPWPWNADYVNEHPTFMNCQRVLSKNHEIEVAAISSDVEAKADTYFIASAPENYDAAMQALKEAAEIMDKIGLEENEVNATLVKPTESDVELKILNAYLKDFWSAPRRWRKKWGFECG